MSEKTIKKYFRVSKRKYDGKSEHTSKRMKLESATEVAKLLSPPKIPSLTTPPSSPSVTSRTLLKSPRKPSSTQKPPSSPFSAPTGLSRGEAAIRLALGKFGKQQLPSTPPIKGSPLLVSAKTDTPSVTKIDTPPLSVTSSSPKLGKFDVFEFSSPQKKSRRRLDYSLLTEKTPAEVKLNIKGSSSDTPTTSKALPTRSSTRTSSSISKEPSPIIDGGGPTTTRTSKRRPAYQRLQALTEPVGPSSITPTSSSSAASLATEHNLALPYDYQVLNEKFKSVETVADMMQKRGQMCPFDALKESVQKILKKNFSQKNLSQMKYVYPAAHVLRQEKHQLSAVSLAMPRYQLTIQCSAHNGEGTGMGTPEELPSGKGISDPTVVVKRHSLFRRNITSIVAEYHKKFLLSLDPPVDVPSDKVYRWHPLFQLDSVPDVKEAELPKPPDMEQYYSASTPRQCIDEEAKKASVRMTKAYEEAKKDIKDKSVSKNNPLKGVSSDLLERIRLKEVANAKAEIMRNPEKEKELAMVSRLPEMSRIIKSLYVSEKKVALTIEFITIKIIDSHKSCLDTNQVEEHIELLVNILPNWLKKLKVRGAWYLKADKSVDFNSSLRILDAKREELTKSI